MSVASRIAEWDQNLGRNRRWGGSVSMGSGPGYSTSETPVGPMVEIYVDETWMDISPDVRYADKINISGGRPNEAATTPPSTCRFVLNNQNGLYSPRNAMSPLYRKIGRNTQVRVSVNQEGTVRYRFYGEIVAWPSQWDNTGNDVWVTIEAAGILRRLSQGDSPLHSTLYRGLLRNTVNPVIAYWPMEDGAESTSLASAVANGLSATIGGTPTLSSYTGFPCSDAIPVLANGSVTGAVPAYTVTGSTQVRFLVAIPAAGDTNGKRLCSITTTGSVRTWILVYGSGSGGTLQLNAYDEDGVLLDQTGVFGFNMNGSAKRVSMEMTQNGADVDVLMQGFEVDYPTVGASTPDTFVGMTVGRVTRISLSIGQGPGETAFGHLSLQKQISGLTDEVSQINAYSGENPTSRLRRLCIEEAVPFRSIAHASYSDVAGFMGPQRSNNLVTLLQECVDTDLGILYEPRDEFGLQYRTRLSLYNQAAKLALSYTNSDLFAPPIPVDDDQLSQNDITVKRDQGSSARSVLETGALSVLPPPAGIGRYDVSPTVSLEDDTLLADQAGWRLLLGTVDEPRYPTMTVHLKRATFTANYDLTAAVLTLGIGDRITISDAPSQVPAGDISQIAQSYTETIDQFEHIISFNGAPESPYHIAVVDDATLGRADTDGSSLTAAVDSTAVSLSVATTAGPVWVDSAAYASEFPFDVMIGGEVMTVTAITGTASPQTFTVTRSVNGVVKAQTTGTDIRLAQPMIISL